MRQHQVRSQIHDGLKHLSNPEIIQKVVESPTKLKKSAKGFLQLLQKHEVALDENGDPDFSHVKNEQVLAELKKKERLVRITLMMEDMEFEYPQKLERMMIKSNILAWLDDEEEKIRALARQAQSDR
jgi:pimeloyl-CoA synthetase